VGKHTGHLYADGSYTDISMDYRAAVDQLNAMVPELYTGSGQP